ncbi:hypothetical protein [Streptomyces sp. NPDC001604]|uniref:hypothetical protein n=1 Tax=Streptomyces sp. NPDC001604 TaxID=3364593 RepID=UPI003684DCC0
MIPDHVSPLHLATVPRERAAAAVFVITAAFTFLALQAMAAPMPWETGKTPRPPLSRPATAAASPC